MQTWTLDTWTWTFWNWNWTQNESVPCQGSYGFSELLELRGSDIEDFINKTIKYSKSGEYTFFVNKKPAAGPTKVELLYPVSRFKTVWSLQKLCRYEILKVVRKDQVDDLPLPFCLKKFLLGPEY
ncbi:hypothetical protein QYM36_002258 [Artemia franciscana]|uniref:SOCS box domain-containing protein n=1 Tax=Artemia franciscana TaxID=6661 RepID=A0AA88I9E8_ARTSF|nr:hypothetical protein QYM36_002258 [Artemia franciscana]